MDISAQDLSRWLADPATHAARQGVCRSITAALMNVGASLYVGGWLVRDPAMEGLGVVTEMGAELASGVVELFTQELWYAGTALVRQLIEVEYLIWHFSTDRTRAATWLASTPEEIRTQFSPGSMRKESAGRFRDKEYWVHCDQGGHPNPRGRPLLKNHSNPLGTRQGSWVDLAQHLERLWGHLTIALDEYHMSEAAAKELRDQLSRLLEEWHRVDQASHRRRTD